MKAGTVHSRYSTWAAQEVAMVVVVVKEAEVGAVAVGQEVVMAVEARSAVRADVRADVTAESSEVVAP